MVTGSDLKLLEACLHKALCQCCTLFLSYSLRSGEGWVQRWCILNQSKIWVIGPIHAFYSCSFSVYVEIIKYNGPTACDQFTIEHVVIIYNINITHDAGHLFCVRSVRLL